VLHNALRSPIAYKQAGVAGSLKMLQPGERTPFHWTSFRAEALLQIALATRRVTRPYSQPAMAAESAHGGAHGGAHGESGASELPGSSTAGARVSVASDNSDRELGEISSTASSISGAISRELGEISSSASSISGAISGFNGGGGSLHGDVIRITGRDNIAGSRLSAFSGGFRIDEIGENILCCGEPEVVFVDVYEYQRRSLRIDRLGADQGFGEFSASALLPTDYHGPWADLAMEKKWAGLHRVVPPPGWVWIDDGWSISSRELRKERELRTPRGGENTAPPTRSASASAPRGESTGFPTTRPIPREEEDKDFGWEYAINWNLPWGARRPESLVRRRRWTRARRATHAVAELRERFVIIDVSMEGPTMLVMLTDGELRPPPYRFDNKSSVQLMVQQKGAPHSRRVLPRSSTLDFAWHAPAGKRVLEVTVEGKRSKSAVAEVNLDRVVEQAQRLRHDQGQLWLHVSLRGDTRTLCITEIEPTDKVTGRAEGEKVKYHLTAALEGIGISLVRSGIGELSYIRLSGIVLTLSASEEKLGAKLCVGDFQVDNQTRDAQLPKVIIRTALLRSRNKDTAAATTPRAQDASAAATPRPLRPCPRSSCDRSSTSSTPCSTRCTRPLRLRARRRSACRWRTLQTVGRMDSRCRSPIDARRSRRRCGPTRPSSP
jgi:hypothetical protein